MKHLITICESGFCNVAATTSYGDNWRDEPGEPAMTLWEVEIPDRYTRAYTQDGAAVFETSDTRDWLAVCGSARCISALDRGCNSIAIPCRRVHIDPITGRRSNFDRLRGRE